jgi:hypothetical protein
LSCGESWYVHDVPLAKRQVIPLSFLLLAS